MAVVFDGLCGVPNALLGAGFPPATGGVVADFSAIAVNAAVSVGLAIGRLRPAGAGVGDRRRQPRRGAPHRLGWLPAGPAPASVPSRRSGGCWQVGLPLAGASLLVFLMLNIDYVVIGGVLDAEALGFYVLAFNISSWPSNLLTASDPERVDPGLRSARREPGPAPTPGFVEIFGVVMTFTLPVAGLLAVLAHRVVEVLYGSRWLTSGSVLIDPRPARDRPGRAWISATTCSWRSAGRRTVMRLQALWVGDSRYRRWCWDPAAHGIRGAGLRPSGGCAGCGDGAGVRRRATVGSGSR